VRFDREGDSGGVERRGGRGDKRKESLLDYHLTVEGGRQKGVRKSDIKESKTMKEAPTLTWIKKQKPDTSCGKSNAAPAASQRKSKKCRKGGRSKGGEKRNQRALRRSEGSGTTERPKKKALRWLPSPDRFRIKNIMKEKVQKREKTLSEAHGQRKKKIRGQNAPLQPPMEKAQKRNRRKSNVKSSTKVRENSVCNRRGLGDKVAPGAKLNSKNRKKKGPQYRIEGKNIPSVWHH